MKKLFIILTLGIMAVSILVSCNFGKSISEHKKMAPLILKNKPILAFGQESKGKRFLLNGEGIKSRYYLITVTKAFSAKLRSKQVKDPSNKSIIVDITVKNVKGTTIDLADLRFILHDVKEHRSFVGKLPTVITDTQLRPNESIFLKVIFEVPMAGNNYHLNIQSSLDPLNVYWKIDHLNKIPK